MASTITRYRIEDEVGRIMTVHGEFAYEDNGWLADFCDEDEAMECAFELLGSTEGLSVERFQTVSRFPDITTENHTERAAA